MCSSFVNLFQPQSPLSSKQSEMIFIVDAGNRSHKAPQGETDLDFSVRRFFLEGIFPPFGTDTGFCDEDLEVVRSCRPSVFREVASRFSLRARKAACFSFYERDEVRIL